MRQRMAVWVLALVSGAVPHGAVLAATASARTVQSEPHYAAWQRALAEAAAEARAAAEAGAACGADDALRPLARRAHVARRDLRAALANQGLAPSPPPAAGPWPWGPGAGTAPRLAAVDSMDTAVIVDDGRIVFMNINTVAEVDPLEAAQAFYHDYDDEYDFLLLFTNFYTELFGGSLIGYHISVANDIEGLGYKHVFGTDHFNEGPDFTGNTALGSLQSFVNLADVRGFPDNPNNIYWRDYTTPTFMAHEIGHRWLTRIRLCPEYGAANALLGRGEVHWSFFFDSRASVVEGNAWEGTVEEFVSGPPTIIYSPLDLYLMGMLAESEVPAGSLWYMAPPYDCSPSVDSRGNPWVPESGPVSGVLCTGGRIDFDLGCIHAANGVRAPAYEEAPKTFRVATMLLTLPDTPATQADLDKLVRMRSALGDYFSAQTLGRGSLDFRTHPVPAWVRFVHLPQGDAEDPTQPIPIHTGVTLEERSLPTTLDDVRVFLHYSVNGAPFQALEMSRTAAADFTSAIPAQPLDSEVRYYLRGTTVLSGHESFFPAGAPAATFSFRIAPDTTPPTIAHVPVRRHSRNTDPVLLRAVVTDAHTVAQVQVEYGAAGAQKTLQNLARQGTTDVWETRLQIPGELQVGERLEYRIVARDAAVTPHVANSPASGFANLAVTLVQYEDAEVEDPLWTHRSLKIDGPDQWHYERHNHTLNGRFSWKVGPDNVSINPRVGSMALEQDAVLEGPAVLLKEGWEMRFYHRNYLRLAPTDGSAMDGAVVQIQFADNPEEVAQDVWWLVESDEGYTHQLGYLALFNPLQWWPCWSGEWDAWRQEHVSETYYPNFTGQRIRFRFRVACSGPWFGTQGGAGWYVDDIEIDPGVPVPVTLEDLQALRTEDGVRLSWKARDLEASDRFRLSRAPMEAGTTSQPGRFEPLVSLEAHPGEDEYTYVDQQAAPAQAYAYRLTLMRGTDATSREVSVGAAALRFALHPNRPNPFNPATEIAFDLPGRAPASLVVYDVRGERVRTLLVGTLAAGPHRLTWDGTDDNRRSVASGVYLAALESQGQRATRRLLLLR